MKLAAALQAAPNGSAERGALADEFAKISTHVKEPADRVVLGKWEEGGGYVAESQKKGGDWYETPAGTYEVMGKISRLGNQRSFLETTDGYWQACGIYRNVGKRSCLGVG